MPIKILIVDDHGVLRAGLKALLMGERGMEVVGEAENGEKAIALAHHLTPQVVLMDISMPGMSGIEAAKKMLQNDPGLEILLLTIHEDEELVRETIQIGASGYILKRAVESELIDAIRAVARGELYVHPAMTHALLEEIPKKRANATREATLTLREIEVLKLIAMGYTNRQVAEKLSLSIRTVESHRANLTGKLGLRSRVDLVRFANEHGYLTLDLN